MHVALEESSSVPILQVEHIFKHSFLTILHMLDILYQGFF
jgi:hypothetical protein